MRKPRRCTSFVHIPHDIIAVILARIPAKSLLRFMTVCKLWHSTICDPQFTELHRRHSQARIGGNYFAFLDRSAEKVTISFKNHGRHRGPRPIEVSFKDVFPRPLSSLFDVFASTIFNGLVCLHSDYNGPHALILNITTREILHLPETRYGGGYVSKHIIGYDPMTEKYKVLHYGKRNDEDPISEIFTLGTTSWRYAVNPPKIIMKSPTHSPCLNGTIYWLARNGDDRFLISFNVDKEVYHMAKLSLPLDDPSNLFTCGGNLGALRWVKEGIEVWNLEDCSNHELKVVAKKMIVFPPSARSNRRLYVLGISPTSEIVFVDDRNIQRRRVFYLDVSKEACRVKYYRFPLHNTLKTCHTENILRLRDPSGSGGRLIDEEGSTTSGVPF